MFTYNQEHALQAIWYCINKWLYIEKHDKYLIKTYIDLEKLKYVKIDQKIYANKCYKVSLMKNPPELLIEKWKNEKLIKDIIE